jgi:hypothetical protein
MMRSRLALLTIVLALGAASGVGAQRPTPTTCSLVAQPTTRLSFDSTAAGTIIYLGGGVELRCPARKIILKGDSAERHADHDYLIGHVVYDEPRLHLTSDFLNHFPGDERVLAVGNVNATLPSGSTLVGPIAEYKRAIPRTRPRDQLTARSRPTITLVQKDSAGNPAPPMTVVAENVFMDGDSLIYASGQAVINRSDITANADSVFLDQTKETVRLMRGPVLKGTKDKPYTLTGDLIDLFAKDKKLSRILSRGTAKAVSDSMTLTSDTIDLRVRDDLLDHAYAWGTTSRARVVSPGQNLLADSLDVSMPGQRVQRVNALRKALAESAPDTARFRLEKSDAKNWLRGDTIVAQFDTIPPRDTSKKNPDVKKLTAAGNASSYYFLAASDTAERRPAINYVTARLINIDIDKSKVVTVTTVDSVSGIYVEPKPESTAPRVNGRGGAAPARPLPTSIVPLPPKRP